MSRRRSIEVPGIEHKNPIPAASRIGPFVVSSGIFGIDPQTGQSPPEIEQQCSLMFANIRSVVEAAGGSIDNIIKLGVWVKDAAFRAHVNREWLAMFPDPHSRPARHTFIVENLQGATLVQCEIMAVLEGGFQ